MDAPQKQVDWTIPLPCDRWAVLSAPRILSEADYDLILGWLELVRPALVDESGEAEAPDATQEA